MNNTKFVSSIRAIIALFSLFLLVGLGLIGCGGAGAGSTASLEGGKPAGPDPVGYWSFDELATLVQNGPVAMTLRYGVGYDRRDFIVTFRATRTSEDDTKLGLFKAVNTLVNYGKSGATLIYQNKVAFGVRQGFDGHNFEGGAASQFWQEADEFVGGRAPRQPERSPSTEPLRLFVPSQALAAGQSWLARSPKGNSIQLVAQPEGQPAGNGRGGGGGVENVSGLTYTGHWSNNTFFLAHTTARHDSGLIIATSHGITGRGAANLPVELAYGFSLDDGSHWGYPSGEFFGTLVFDGRYCTLIDQRAEPVVTRSTASLTMNGQTEVRNHFVARDGGTYEEGFANFMELYFSTGNLFKWKTNVGGTATVRWTAQVEGGEVEVFEETLEADNLMLACQDWAGMVTYDFFSMNEGSTLVRSELEITLND
ncbi:hypothetical protein A3A71_01620 [Candidatus Berkelbacteria bacterium RIFCSPLOWO2_01_FULL_50_28]|uniref:Uncharacterized protein n=1 Tax=Candidatus Berkelbacteria bacterium RIFCSPLOWO2_01_FULL_50_28 TaxID=1797471 RepID=A0A1F5EBI8_9BACT|nr:MAG: hypothetical protein A3A71_01620 [Candidatus Berkelbacteria bacterium RIFCSPLOWO2_01_FULL_50_28]